MRILLISLYTAWKVMKIKPGLFIITLALGLSWRFLLILAYVFSIQAIAIVFNASIGQEKPVSLPYITGSVSYVKLSMAMLFAFFCAALADFYFTKFRSKIEKEVELDLIKNLVGSTLEFHNLLVNKSHYCSQILTKTFDLIYSGLLVVVSLSAMVVISPTLGGFLGLGGVVVYLIVWFQKRLHNAKELGMQSRDGSAARVRRYKLERSAKIRAITTFFAGTFLAAIVLLVGNQSLGTINIVELALVAFLTRFFVAFLAMLYMNINTCSDNTELLREYIQFKLI